MAYTVPMEEMALFQGTPVTLTALLDSREARAARERALLREYGAPVLVVLVNMPGAVKDHPAARRAHAAAMEALKAGLLDGGFSILHQEVLPLPTGPEGYFSVNAPAEELKELCCGLEESHPYGRLFDLDVIGMDGAPLSRRDFGRPGRRCLVCGGPAADCVSRQLHPLSEVLGAIAAILDQ